MRGRLAKALRNEVRIERAQESGVTETGWVQKKSGAVVVAPTSIRAMYQRLKGKYKMLRRLPPHLSRDQAEIALLTAAEARQRGIQAKAERIPKQTATRAKRAEERQQAARRRIVRDKIIAIIQRPLMLILEYCQPAQQPDGSFTPHETYAQARHAADRGDGATVRRMAYQFA